MRRGLPLLALAISCAVAPPLPPPPPPSPAPAPAPSWLSPPRYVVVGPSVIERTGEGLDHVVVAGRRLVLRGPEIVEAGPAEPELDGGARAPGWVRGAARYVFWKGRQVWGSETFMGALQPLGALSGDPGNAFDWLDGTGVTLAGGAAVVPAGGGPAGRTGVPGFVRGIAADARRAVALTALGHTLLTLDGGTSYRDVTADFGASPALEVRGDAIAAVLSDGRARLVTAEGTIVDDGVGLATGAGPPRPRVLARGRLPPEVPDAFERIAHEPPIHALARGGLPLADGGVVVAASGVVARIDPATLHATSAALLDPGLRDADCTPIRVASAGGGAILLACVGRERAAVVDLEGSPRTERTFDLASASDLTRFMVSDDAIGWLGPCDGTPPHVPDPLTLTGGEPYNASHRRSPVFCVRAGRDAWVEHRLDPADAADVIAWIPRAGGGAVALVARYGPFLDERERIAVHGALRVVRLARSEPPVAIPPWDSGSSDNVDLSLRALPDDTIEGWLPSATSSSGTIAFTIDAGGHARAHPTPPRVQQIVQAGRFALAGTEDDRLWETVDGGHHWAPAEPPPGAHTGWQAHPSACSAAGCVFSDFVRLGWSAAGEADAGPAPLASSPPRPNRADYRRPVPVPVVRLSCAPAAPAEGRRNGEPYAFGVTAQPQQRSSYTRIGTLGVAMIPWSGSTQMPTTGDADFAWVSPLDLTGEIHRVSVPLARIALPGRYRTSDLRLGWLLAPGGLEVFAAGHRDHCFAPLLDLAGITRPLGACADDPNAGVDLGGRVVTVSRAYSAVSISAADAPPPARGLAARGAAPPRPLRAPATLRVALHELHRTQAGAAVRGVVFGAGTRDGAPVVVALDVNGDASLAPIDPERGTLGAEERLRPLPEASLGSSPACARPKTGSSAEARVVLPLEGQIGIDRAALLGVAQTTGGGVAVLRWSRERACLDAVEIPVHDDRYDESPYDQSGVLRKIVARFDGTARALLLLVAGGSEVRQRLACTALLPGSGEEP